MKVLYWLGWGFFRLLFATFFHWRHFNAERVPSCGPVILAANHASLIDPPLVGCPLHRDVYFLARASLFRFPVVGWLLRHWNAVPLDRESGGAAGVRIATELLRQGH